MYCPQPDPEAVIGAVEWCIGSLPQEERLPPFDHSTHGALVAWAPVLPLLALTKPHPHRIVVVDVVRQCVVHSCPSPDGEPYQVPNPNPNPNPNPS